jgi:hypothetical protein
MEIKCSNYQEWASASGYKLIPLRTNQAKENLSGKYDFIENIKDARQILLDQEKFCPVLIECRNIKLVVWNWEENPDTHNYRYFFISENNELLIDNPIDSKVWLQYFPIFSELNGQIQIQEEVLVQSENILFDSAPIMAAGHSQFAHWFSDHLSNFFVAPFCDLDCNQFLVSKLTYYQNEALEALNFFQSNPTLHTIDLRGSLFKTFKINQIYLLANYGIRDRFNLLRQVIEEAYILPSLTNKMCYMPRGEVRGQNRIANEGQVLDLCRKYNIEIADAAHYSFRECVTNYPKYGTFISGPSSANTNFSLFSSKESRLLYGLPSSYEIPSSTVVVGSAYYTLPKLNDTEIMMLDMANQAKNKITDPVYFSIPLLEKHIQKRIDEIKF